MNPIDSSSADPLGNAASDGLPSTAAGSAAGPYPELEKDMDYLRRFAELSEQIDPNHRNSSGANESR